MPNTKDISLRLNKYKQATDIIGDITKAEGWAFTIRRSIFEKAYPIPRELVHNFGDNYLFFTSLKLGYRNVKMLKNHITHFGSMTGGVIKTKVDFNEQRIIWNKIKERLDSNV
jgi:GT2 family glycosyltransferase